MDIDDEPDFGTADPSSDEKAVNAELKARYAGTISFFADQVNSWTDSDKTARPSHRNIDPARTKTLEANFREKGLVRTVPRHHMHVTTTQENCRRILAVLRGTAFRSNTNHFTSLSKALKARNEQYEYPKLLPALRSEDETIERVTCQAGRHRWEALEKYQDDKTKRWWPCRIYVEPLSVHSLARLRDNNHPPQLDLSDGEKLLQLHHYQEEVETIGAQLSKTNYHERARLKARLKEAKEAAEQLGSEFDRPAL
jgi:Protein of unknown function (DUF3723)